jgi:hypothetical protein
MIESIIVSSEVFVVEVDEGAGNPTVYGKAKDTMEEGNEEFKATVEKLLSRGGEGFCVKLVCITPGKPEDDETLSMFQKIIPPVCIQYIPVVTLEERPIAQA